MPDYLSMLRANNVFGRDSFGMPRGDDESVGNMFAAASSVANSLKRQDMSREKEMMQFEDSMAAQAQQRAMMNQQLQQNEITPYGRTARLGKQKIINYAPPTQLQRQFREEDEDIRNNKFRMGQLEAAEGGRLNTALTVGRQHNEADMAKTTAELNAAAQQGNAARTSAEKIAADRLAATTAESKTERDFKSKEAKDARSDKGFSTNIIDDPDNPGKKIAVRINNVNGKVERLKLDDEQVTGAQKLGAPGKSDVSPDLKANREMTKSVLDDLDEMLTPEGKLQSHVADATGRSRIPGSVASAFNLGSLTPNTTKGTAAINTFKSKLVLDLMSRLRAQSKTGSLGFGSNMNIKEFGTLEKSVGKLDPDMSDADFEKELGVIRDKLRLIMQDAPPQKGSHEEKQRLDSQSLIEKYSRGS